MRTTAIIVFCLILFLVGLALAGYSQGITNSGGFITGTSTNYLDLSGSGDMTLKSTTADRTSFGHVAINLTGTDVYKITIPDDSFITVEGNLSISDTLEMKASSSGMASLITNGTVTGSKAIVEQHLSQDRWQMVSSPVTSAQADVYAGIYVLDWNEPDSTWSYITSLSDPLNTAEGYFIWSGSTISSPTDVEFTGMLNTGNQTAANLSYNDSNIGEGHGWNLVGNPYSSAIEWTNSWTKSNIDATIYVYTGSTYLTWNYNLGGFGTKADGSIPSTQGFWVKANATSPSVTIPNSSRIHSSQSFYKDDEAVLNSMFRVTLNKNEKADEMILGCNPDATTSFDSEFDAFKLFGNEDLPQLYSIDEETKLCVSLFSKGNHMIPVGVRIAEAGEHVLSFSGLKDFDNSIEVYLKDKGLTFSSSKMINLRQEQEYTFSSEKGFEEGRFEIHFVCNGSENRFATMNAKGDAIIYSYKDEVYVNYQFDVPGDVTVYDILGQEILTESLTINQLNKVTINNGAGYYIVKVISGSVIKSEKVYLN